MNKPLIAQYLNYVAMTTRFSGTIKFEFARGSKVVAEVSSNVDDCCLTLSYGEYLAANDAAIDEMNDIDPCMTLAVPSTILWEARQAVSIAG